MVIFFCIWLFEYFYNIKSIVNKKIRKYSLCWVCDELVFDFFLVS